MRSILRFLAFPREERRVLVWLVPMLAQARIGIRVADVSAVRRLARWIAPRSAIRPERLAELVNVASQRLPGFTTCLPRAVVLESLLQKAGWPAELKVGVAPLRAGSRPDAHAWVELGGAAVAENVTGYTALPLFGTRG